MQQTDYTILGVDPGTNLLGYALIHVQKPKPTIAMSGVLDLKKMEGLDKLGKIYTSLATLFKSNCPSCLAIETAFYGKNVQSMLKLGRVQGIAIGLASSMQIPVFEYAPLRIKQMITGRGAASKEEVMQMLTLIFNLRKYKYTHSFDETDALAVAYCHYLHVRNPSPQPITEIGLIKKQPKLSSAKQRQAWATFIEAKK